MKVQFKILVSFLALTVITIAVTLILLGYNRGEYTVMEETSRESVVVSNPVSHVEMIETKLIVDTKSGEVVEATEESTEECVFNDEEKYIIDTLARTIYCEAGDQSYEGMVAVGQVVRNRVDSEYFPNDYKKVIYQRNQFSGVSTSKFNVGQVPEECVRAAKEVITRTEEFYMPSHVLFFKTVDCKENWSYEFYKMIGDHNFYKYGEE